MSFPTMEDFNNALKAIHDFNAQVIKVMAVALPVMGPDVLTAIGAITGAVAARGLDPVADMASLTAVNKIAEDLLAAETAVKAQQPAQ